MKKSPLASKIFAVLTVTLLFTGSIFKLTELPDMVGNYLLCFSIAFAVALLINNIASYSEGNKQTSSI